MRVSGRPFVQRLRRKGLLPGLLGGGVGGGEPGNKYGLIPARVKLAVRFRERDLSHARTASLTGFAKRMRANG
jgi:hypothetical protein